MHMSSSSKVETMQNMTALSTLTPHLMTLMRGGWQEQMSCTIAYECDMRVRMRMHARALQLELERVR